MRFNTIVIGSGFINVDKNISRPTCN